MQPDFAGALRRRYSAPSVQIIPFPSSRRAAFLIRNGRHAASYRMAAAENYLNGLVARHRDRLNRLGVDEVSADEDASELRAALFLYYARYRRRQAQS